MGRDDIYVLRLWRRRTGSVRWAGRVEHLTDGEVLRFTDPEALLAHLHRVVGASAEQMPPAEQEPAASGTTPALLAGARSAPEEMAGTPGHGHAPALLPRAPLERASRQRGVHPRRREVEATAHRDGQDSGGRG